MTTSPREALERLTRWREQGASTSVFVSAESARHAFAADVLALLSTVEQMREALTLFTQARYAIDHGGPANAWALGRLHEAWCKACDCLPAAPAEDKPHD